MFIIITNNILYFKPGPRPSLPSTIHRTTDYRSTCWIQMRKLPLEHSWPMSHMFYYLKFACQRNGDVTDLNNQAMLVLFLKIILTIRNYRNQHTHLNWQTAWFVPISAFINQLMVKHAWRAMCCTSTSHSLSQKLQTLMEHGRGWFKMT